MKSVQIAIMSNTTGIVVRKYLVRRPNLLEFRTRQLQQCRPRLVTGRNEDEIADDQRCGCIYRRLHSSTPGKLEANTSVRRIYYQQSVSRKAEYRTQVTHRRRNG